LQATGALAALSDALEGIEAMPGTALHWLAETASGGRSRSIIITTIQKDEQLVPDRMIQLTRHEANMVDKPSGDVTILPAAVAGRQIRRAGFQWAWKRNLTNDI
jgi:hypothetical protein